MSEVCPKCVLSRVLSGEGRSTAESIAAEERKEGYKARRFVGCVSGSRLLRSITRTRASLSALFVSKWFLRYHMAKSIKKATQLETLQHSADNQRRKQELVLRRFELDQNQSCFSPPCLSFAIFFPTPNSACYMRDLLYSATVVLSKSHTFPLSDGQQGRLVAGSPGPPVT